MARLHRFLLVCLIAAFTWTGVASAQETQQEKEDKGFLTNFIEETLTDAGREVQITNFKGALSSRATVDELTIADAEGVWLIARGLTLNWDRSAIFKGVLDVTELSADEIILPRLPTPEEGLPPPEAGEFRVPELPVEVRIGALIVERLELGRPVLGRAAVMQISGAASLAGGGGRVNLQATRTDGRLGEIRLAASYNPDSNIIAVDLGLEEQEGGIAASALNIPGEPSVSLTLAGEGPVEDFDARLRLAADGQERVSGTVGLTADSAGNRAGRVDISGDLTALLPASERAFFAGESRLVARGTQDSDGTLTLEQFTLDTRFADLSGSAALGADGGVAAIDIEGEIADREGDPVVLPGGAGTVARADITLSYDRAVGDDWQGRALLREYRTEGVTIATARLDGNGQIVPEGRDGAGLTGNVALDLSGLAIDDPALARLLGGEVAGRVTIEKRPETPFRFSALDVLAGGVGLTGSGTVEGFTTGFRSTIDIGVAAPDLSRLSLLTGLADLGGQGEVNVSGEVTPLSGGFDLRIDARTDPLRLGIAEADALLRPATALSADVDRGPTGITLRRLNIENSALKLTANGKLATEGSRLEYDARLKDLSALPVPDGVPEGQGMAELTGVVRLGPAGTGLQQFSTTGTLAAGDAARVRLPIRDTVLLMNGADLSAEYAVESGAFNLSFAARDLEEVNGRADLLSLTLEGEAPGGIGSDDMGAVTARMSLDATGLRLSDPKLAQAIGSDLSLDAALAYAGKALTMTQIVAEAGNARLTGDLRVPLGREAGDYTFDGALALQDFARFNALTGVPLDGSARAEVVARYAPEGGDFRVDAALRDLVETRGRAERVSLSLDGRVPQDNPDQVVADIRLTAEGLRLSDPKLARAVGPSLSATTRLNYAPELLTLTAIEADAGDARITGDLVVPLGADAGPTRFDGRASVGDLARFSDLAGAQLRGATEAEIALSMQDAAIDLDVTGSARRLGLGTPTLDRILAGNVDYRLDVNRDADGWNIDTARIDGARLRASASGNATRGFDIDARLSDLALIAPDFAGPVTASGRVRPMGGGGYDVDLGLTGPGGTTLDVSGRYGANGADLAARGRVPLGLLNPVVAPRRLSGEANLDLRLNGAPRIENLSGRVTTSNAQVSAPTLNVSFRDLTLSANLTGGRAVIDGAARGTAGGGVAVQGSIGLSRLDADLRILFDRLKYTRGDTIETRVNGTLTVTGPLSGGGVIGGRLRLEDTEVRVAPTGVTNLGKIPDIDFVNSSAGAATTRQRAGLTANGTSSARTGGTGGGSRVPFQLDFRVSAPNQVFVRGRGLDAELGGEFRIRGTTRNIVPQGRLDLIRGRLSILTQRFELDEGSAQILGDLDPYIRLVASTEKEGVSVMVIIEGRASEPEVRFESVPPLPEDEVLALLIFGRSLEGLSPFQALELASAIATLSGRGGVGVIARLRENFGLDDLDLTTDEDGNTAVRVGKYLSENVYTDVTIDSGGETELNLNLDLSPNLKAKGGVSSDGDTSLGIFFEKDY